MRSEDTLTYTHDLLAGELAHELEQERRIQRLHGRTVPVLRLVGATMLVAAVALHNAWIRGGANGQALLGFAAVVGAYALLGWLLLRDAHPAERLVSRSNALMVADLVPLALAVHLTGGPESWLFWIFLIRVADQSAGRIE